MPSRQMNFALNDDPLLSTDEAGNYLRIHRRTLNTWVQQKRYLELLKPIFIGTKLAFRRSSLEAFLEARTVKKA